MSPISPCIPMPCVVCEEWGCCQSPGCSKVGSYLPKDFILGAWSLLYCESREKLGQKRWAVCGEAKCRGHWSRVSEVCWDRNRSRTSPAEIKVWLQTGALTRTSAAKSKQFHFGRDLISPVCKQPLGWRLIPAVGWRAVGSGVQWGLLRLVFMSASSSLTGKTHC